MIAARPQPRRIALAVALALATQQRARADAFDWFHSGVWQGTAELGVAYDKESLHTDNAGQSVDFKRERTHERVTIENNGFYAVDPGLATGNLGLTFDLLQTRENMDGFSDTRRARLVGYNLDSTFLTVLPYNGRLFANRSQNQLILPFGRTDLTLQSEGASFRLREDSPLREHGFPYFSADMRVERQTTHETTTSVLGQTFSTNETQNTFAVEARKGFLNSDLDVHYQLIDLDDPQFPRSTFRSQSENVNYSLDFGSDLNKRFDARLFHFDRNGFTPLRTTNTNESLHVDHYQNFSTNYRLITTSTSTDSGTTNTRDVAFDLRYEPYKQLFIDNAEMALHQDLPTGTRDTYATTTGVQYRHPLGESALVNAHASGRYQLDDNRLTASAIQVVDEPQSAPASLGAGAGFLLAQPFAMASSIVVVDARGGARFPTTLGIDYTIVTEGNLTRIVPLPTSAVIQANDPLLVTYIYELDPSIKYRTLSGSFGAGIDYPWLSLSYAHDQSDQHLLSGNASQFLENLKKDTFLGSLRGEWSHVRLQVDGGYVRYDATLLAYRQTRYGELMSYRPSPSTNVSLTADRTTTDFTLPAHRTDSSTARLSLDWLPPGTWPSYTVTSFVGRRVYKDSLQATETINEASFKGKMTYGKLDLISVLTASSRAIDGTKTNNFSIELSAIRRF